MLFDFSKLYQVDDDGHLFISPVITDWGIVSSYGIDTVIDLEGGLDECIPTVPNGCLYVYFPIFDENLPDLQKLEAVVSLGAHLVGNGHRVLSHCGMGFNRSALVAGRILHRRGCPESASCSSCAIAGPARSSMKYSRSTSSRCPRRVYESSTRSFIAGPAPLPPASPTAGARRGCGDPSAARG